MCLSQLGKAHTVQCDVCVLNLAWDRCHMPSGSFAPPTLCFLLLKGPPKLQKTYIFFHLHCTYLFCIDHSEIYPRSCCSSISKHSVITAYVCSLSAGIPTVFLNANRQSRLSASCDTFFLREKEFNSMTKCVLFYLCHILMQCYTVHWSDTLRSH